jgi:hypothetical protein
MTVATNKDLHRQWALAGASVRLREIQGEISEIYRAFPELRKGPRVSTKGTTAGADTKKQNFSARGKKAISEGMRKYWARRKALAAKGSPMKK